MRLLDTITQELLKSERPGETLRRWKADGKLDEVLPEVSRLFGVPQPPAHHPEVDTGEHIALCLEAAASLHASTASKFSVLLHDLGKALTQAHLLPAHHDHENTGLPLVSSVCDRLAAPSRWKKLAQLVCQFHLHAHRAFEMKPATVVGFLASRTGLAFDPSLLEDFLLACEADSRGRLGTLGRPYPQAQYLRLVAWGIRSNEGWPGIARSAKAEAEVHRARVTLAKEFLANRFAEHQKSRPSTAC